MGKIISFGKSNSYLKYIFLSIFFKMINEGLYGFKYNNLKEVRIIPTDSQESFSKHRLVHQLVNYMGTLLISFLCDKYSSRQQKITGKSRISNEESPNQLNSSSHIILIHNSSVEEDENYLTNDLSKSVLIIIFFWIFESHLLELFTLCLKDLDFWMLELLIITYLSANMFKLQIYKHQKLAIYLNCFPCLLKIATIILSFYKKKKQDENEKSILYVEAIWWIPVGIVIYIFLISIRSYVYSKIKWFMDLKYITSTQLLIFYGMLGSIICLVICTITTFVKCKNYSNPDDNILDYICLVEDNSKIYFDSFKIYFKAFSKDDNNDLDIFVEILVLIIGFVTFFFSAYFTIQVIKYLTPVYLIFSNPIYFFIEKIIIAIYTEIKEYNQNDNSEYIKFILDSSGDLFSIIALLIYLEIVELNFKEYNYNLRKNIIQRSMIESGQIDNIVNQEEELEEETDLASSNC